MKLHSLIPSALITGALIPDTLTLPLGFIRALPLSLLIVTATLSGCDKSRPHPAPTANTEATNVSYPDEWPTDRLIGQWNGPEGTFLRIGGQYGTYVVTIQNLDGQGHYNGRAIEGQIQFERNGVTETLRPTKGEETGMKWLSDKTNCLTVHTGEGYCKD